MENSLTAKLKGSAPGQTAEETNSATGTAGLYRHPVSGAEIHTLSDPLYGDAQSEAAIRVGFVRVRDTEPGEIVQINLVQDVQAARVGNTEDVKGILARLNALEAENAQLKAGQVDGTSDVVGGEAAKADGEAAVAAQASTTEAPQVQNVKPADEVVGDAGTAPAVPPVTAPVDTTPVADATTGDATTPSTDASEAPATGETAPSAPELPLTEQSTDELKATASAEGLDTANLNTNEDLIAAIEAKRAESGK